MNQYRALSAVVYGGLTLFAVSSLFWLGPDSDHQAVFSFGVILALTFLAAPLFAVAHAALRISTQPNRKELIKAGINVLAITVGCAFGLLLVLSGFIFLKGQGESLASANAAYNRYIEFIASYSYLQDTKPETSCIDAAVHAREAKKKFPDKNGCAFILVRAPRPSLTDTIFFRYKERALSYPSEWFDAESVLARNFDRRCAILADAGITLEELLWQGFVDDCRPRAFRVGRSGDFLTVKIARDALRRHRSV